MLYIQGTVVANRSLNRMQVGLQAASCGIRVAPVRLLYLCGMMADAFGVPGNEATRVVETSKGLWNGNELPLVPMRRCRDSPSLGALGSLIARSNVLTALGPSPVIVTRFNQSWLSGRYPSCLPVSVDGTFLHQHVLQGEVADRRVHQRDLGGGLLRC